jgi:hypothetical protein
MRFAFFAFPVLLLLPLPPGLTPASAQSAGAPPPAGEWCGFLDKSGARVRCGFVSRSDCLHALGDSKDAICIPDPEFALKGSTRTTS